MRQMLARGNERAVNSEQGRVDSLCSRTLGESPRPLARAAAPAVQGKATVRRCAPGTLLPECEAFHVNVQHDCIRRKHAAFPIT
eukprot:scaffold211079_cov25-Tisochrysis_lutea.AAC.1